MIYVKWKVHFWISKIRNIILIGIFISIYPQFNFSGFRGQGQDLESWQCARHGPTLVFYRWKITQRGRHHLNPEKAYIIATSMITWQCNVHWLPINYSNNGVYLSQMYVRRLKLSTLIKLFFFYEKTHNINSYIFFFLHNIFSFLTSQLLLRSYYHV